MSWVIYQIHCKGESKSYIGQTTNIIKRFAIHTSKPTNPGLKAALAKHGRFAFSYAILAEADTQEEANDLECAYISLVGWHKLWNQSCGGQLVAQKSDTVCSVCERFINDERRGIIAYNTQDGAVSELSIHCEGCDLDAQLPYSKRRFALWNNLTPDSMYILAQNYTIPDDIARKHMFRNGKLDVAFAYAWIRKRFPE